MLSKSATYALRAVVFLASRDPSGETPTPIQDIAESLGVPQNYLSKVTHRLARAGVLTSTRGPGGGFALAVSADRLALAEVTAPFDTTGGPLPCLLMDQPCNPDEPCVAHARWKAIAVEMREFFVGTTVAELLKSSAVGAPAVF